jgi:hypothetical protein
VARELFNSDVKQMVLARSAILTFIYVGIAVASSVAGSQANELSLGKHDRAAARCAVYGPGFTAVEGSDTCVRIGGHVRVETGMSRSSSGWGTRGAAPAALNAREDGDLTGSIYDMPVPPDTGLSRTHLRLPDDGLSRR